MSLLLACQSVVRSANQSMNRTGDEENPEPLTARWWSSLSEDERRQAQAEARRYESLSEDERKRMWGER